MYTQEMLQVVLLLLYIDRGIPFVLNYKKRSACLFWVFNCFNSLISVRSQVSDNDGQPLFVGCPNNRSQRTCRAGFHIVREGGALSGGLAELIQDDRPVLP